MNTQLTKAWRDHASLSRSDVFGTADPRPMPQTATARQQVNIAAPGMIGERYKPGGTVLLSINPSGGSDDYQPSKSDIELYDAFREFALDGMREHLDAMSDMFARQMPGWLVYKQHIGPILDALGTSRRDISYVYTVPFRVQGNSAAKIKKFVIENVWKKSLADLLDQLAPSLIIAIDRASEACALRHATNSASCEVKFYTRKRDEHVARRKFLGELKVWART